MKSSDKTLLKPAANLSAEDLSVFNDLLSGIVRARLPLEAGLSAVAADWPGRAGSMLRQLQSQLQQGQSLESALTMLSSTLPGEYSALIRAGQYSGRLPEMLDDLSRLARLRQESRRLAVISLVYPLIVAVFATLLGLFVLTRILPVMLVTMLDSRVDVPAWLTAMGHLGNRLTTVFSPEI